MTRRALLLAGALAVAGGCGDATSSSVSEAPVPDPAQAPFQPLLDMQQMMHLVIEPAAEVLWDSAGEVITAEATTDLAPTTDEGWHRVASAAATLAESGNLLMLPSRAEGRADWIAFSGGLVDTGRQALEAAEARDGDALFEAGAAIYQVCLACHRSYALEASNRFTQDP